METQQLAVLDSGGNTFVPAPELDVSPKESKEEFSDPAEVLSRGALATSLLLYETVYLSGDQ